MALFTQPYRMLIARGLDKAHLDPEDPKGVADANHAVIVDVRDVRTRQLSRELSNEPQYPECVKAVDRAIAVHVT